MTLLDDIFATGLYQWLLHGGRDYTKREKREREEYTGGLLTTTTPGTVATPTITLAAGSYAGAQTTTITCSESGAKIYYSFGGGLDASNGNLYSSAITIPVGTHTLTAVARKLGMESSATESATYVIS